MFTPNFKTPKGIRAVADHLETLADYPDAANGNWRDRYRVGHLSIWKHPEAFRGAAKRLRSNASGTARHPGAGSPFNPPGKPYTPSCIAKLDAVRAYGSPEAGLAAIERQLDAQAADMEPADVKRCQKAAEIIRGHITSLEREAEENAREEALLATVAAGTQPGIKDITPTGTEVALTHAYREHLGTVSSCKICPHPILGKTHPVAIYTIEITHTRESRGKAYRYFPVKPRTVSKVIWSQIKVLEPCFA